MAIQPDGQRKLGSGIGCFWVEGLDFAALWRGITGGLMAFPKKGVNPSEIYCIFEGQ